MPLVLQQYEKWNNFYCDTVEPFCHKKDAFSYFNPTENTVLIYDVIEHLTVYAYYLSFVYKGRERCMRVVNMIRSLIINNQSFYYSPYDCHIRTVSMLYRLFERVGIRKDLIALINNQCIYLYQWYKLYKAYPAPEDSFEEALNIRDGRNENEYQTSIFWGFMMQWIVLYEQQDLYSEIKDFLNEDLSGVTKCVWFIKSEEEDLLYSSGVLYGAGDCTALDVSSFQTLKDNIDLVEQQYKKDYFSFNDYSFDALEFILSKYYGNYVRVKKA